MRILVLDGTAFGGRAIIEDASQLLADIAALTGKQPSDIEHLPDPQRSSGANIVTSGIGGSRFVLWVLGLAMTSRFTRTAPAGGPSRVSTP